MRGARIGNAVEAAEPVGDNVGAFRDDPARHRFNDLLREPPHAPELDAMALAIHGGLDSHHEWRLAGAAATAVAAAARAAEIGVVHLVLLLRQLSQNFGT